MKVIRKFYGTFKVRYLLDELSPSNPNNPKLGNIKLDRLESLSNATSAVIASKAVKNGDRVEVTFKVAKGDANNDDFMEFDWKRIFLSSWFVYGLGNLVYFFITK